MEIGKSGKRNVIERDEVVEIHPEDAQDLDIVEGEFVEVISSRDRLRAVARLTGVHRGMMSYTSLFGDVATRLDASSEPDPIMNVEGLPLVNVRVEKTAETEAAAD